MSDINGWEENKKDIHHRLSTMEAWQGHREVLCQKHVDEWAHFRAEITGRIAHLEGRLIGYLAVFGFLITVIQKLWK